MKPRRAVVAELLDTLVLDLLNRMGYGTNRADLQRLGGIDGAIYRIS